MAGCFDRRSFAKEYFAEATPPIGSPTSELADLQQQCSAAREQRDRIERELTALTSRIEPLFTETGLTPQSDSPSEQLRQLSRELAEETTRSGRRDAILADLKKLSRIRIEAPRRDRSPQAASANVATTCRCGRRKRIGAPRRRTSLGR